jgi:hypothetical protein
MIRKGNKYTQNGKEEIKLLLDDMIAYVETPRYLTNYWN